MPPKEVCDARLLQVVMEHSKSLERMSWRNMDPEEFAEGFLPFLKSLGKVSPRLRKSELLRAFLAAKLSLSAAESHLLCSKVTGSISYAKKRLRDAGSGRFLPSPVQALLKIWCRAHMEPKPKKVVPPTANAAGKALQVPMGAGLAKAGGGQDSSILGPGPGKESPTCLAVASAGSVEKELHEKANKEQKNIRSILGLSETKPKAPVLNLLSDGSSSCSSSPKGAMPRGSASASSMPRGSASANSMPRGSASASSVLPSQSTSGSPREQRESSANLQHPIQHMPDSKTSQITTPCPPPNKCTCTLKSLQSTHTHTPKLICTKAFL